MTDEELYANSYIGRLEVLVNELKKAVTEVWNMIKKTILKVFEAWVIVLQNEEANLTLRIYQRTKSKRIKRKKFKQLVGYLVDELVI